MQIDLTHKQFAYLRAAVRRDLNTLEEMAPWDIDANTAEHAEDVRLCKEMIQYLEVCDAVS